MLRLCVEAQGSSKDVACNPPGRSTSERKVFLYIYIYVCVYSRGGGPRTSS